MREFSRRAFLRRSTAAAGTLAVVAAAGGPLIVPSRVLGQEAPSNRINVGVIGLSAQGRGLLGNVLNLKEFQVVGLCDVFGARVAHYTQNVNKRYADKNGIAGYKGVKGFEDYRQLLRMADLDAVIIAVPDHWHALIAVAACRAGKDVYCEKPLALTNYESRAIADAAKQYGTAFQVGSMQRSDSTFRFACELVRNGTIGKIKEIWINIGPPAKPFCDLAPEPVPATLNWDFWIGPSQFRPFNKGLCPDGTDAGFGGWRGYAEFGSGGQADFGAHHFDIAQWGLGTDHTGPVEVEPPPADDPRRIGYRYADGVRMYVGEIVKGAATTWVGEKGKVSVNRNAFLQTEPANLVDIRFGPNDVRLYDSRHHVLNWADGIRTRRDCICTAETGHRTATICQIGVIAHRLGRKLQWDPVAERFTNDDEANRLLRREMRSPWTL